MDTHGYLLLQSQFSASAVSPQREEQKPQPCGFGRSPGADGWACRVVFQKLAPFRPQPSGLCLSARRAAEPPGSSGFLERTALGQGPFKQKWESGFPRPRASSPCVLPLPFGNPSSATATQIPLADSGLPRAQKSGIWPEIGHLPCGRFCAKQLVTTSDETDTVPALLLWTDNKQPIKALCDVGLQVHGNVCDRAEL